ncbi:hypothetical protein PspLS_04640 [Pyricularia sp. CBS 133598]|nr:hypothetical protein PspLS_04640 [Pyricularia sp. CBS 133598]
MLSNRESKMVLVAVGERQPECHHIIPVYGSEQRKHLVLAPHAPPVLFPQDLNSGFLQSQHSRDPGQSTQPKWATALP